MNSTAHAVLFALLDLAKNDRAATVLRLVDATGLERAVVEATLASLDRAGYVDASRVRLSMPGLAAAAMLGAPRARRARTLRAA
ncbi:MAG: hypothetical protein U0414_05490 [Polyangiaceae bacterium]